MKKIDVTIVIVNWNTREILKNCLKSIYDDAGPVEYEVVVVDNGSTDGSVDMIKAGFPRAQLIENNKNRGFAAANNQGIALARGRYVLLLNSDTIILDRAVAKTVDFADKHPKAGVVGCRVLNADKTLQLTCFRFPSILNEVLASLYLNKLFPRNKFFGRYRMSWWERNDIREVDVVTGCFMLVRKEAIDEVGVMDERYFIYTEEADWCYRFMQSGWKRLFTPNAEIIHLHGASGSQQRPEMALQLRGSGLQYFKKHQGYLSYVLVCFIIALFFLLRIPYWLGKTIISHNGRKSHWQRTVTYLKGVIYALSGGRGLLCLKSERDDGDKFIADMRLR